MYFFDPWFGVVFPQNGVDMQTPEPTPAMPPRANRSVGLVCAGIAVLISAIGACILNA